MRARSVLQVGMMVLLAVGLTMCKQPEQPPADAEEPPAAVASPEADASSSEVVAEEVRQIQKRLRNARRHVRDGNRQEGSLELSEAANVFSQHATESSNALKEDLEFSASEFSGMAERVFDTPSVTMTEMDAALTRAFWAQAAYTYRKAAERWADGQKPQTAAYLNATATFIDESVGYFSGGLEVQSETLIREMRGLARELTSLDGNAITAQMEDFGRKVEQYSRQVRQAIEENVEAV